MGDARHFLFYWERRHPCRQIFRPPAAARDGSAPGMWKAVRECWANAEARVAYAASLPIYQTASVGRDSGLEGIALWFAAVRHGVRGLPAPSAFAFVPGYPL